MYLEMLTTIHDIHEIRVSGGVFTKATWSAWVVLAAWVLVGGYAGCQQVLTLDEPQLAKCGDRVVHTLAGEEYDDGETTMSCNADCTVARCDPVTGDQHAEVIGKSVGELLGRHHDNIRAAETIHLLMQLVKLDMSISEVQAVLDTWDPNNSTTLIDEYKQYIESYMQKH